MVKRRVVTQVEEEVLERMSHLRELGHGSIYSQVERYIVEGVARTEQGIRGSKASDGGVEGLARPDKAKDWRDVLTPPRLGQGLPRPNRR